MAIDLIPEGYLKNEMCWKPLNRAGTKLNEVITAVNAATDGVETFSIATVTTALRAANGTVAIPSISFTNDTDCGFYRIGANNIGLALNGAKVLDMATTGLTVTGQITASTTITATTGIVVGASGIIDNTSGFLAGIIPFAAPQAISGAGAILPSTYYTAVTTTGANAYTFANGTVRGQLKKITMVVDGGDGIITPTSLAGGNTTITLNDVGDFIVLMWNSTAWLIIENSGCIVA